MISPDDTAALVLAAGRSSRMGCFKPLLAINGRPIIQQTIQNIRDAGVEKILVVIGHQAETILPILDDMGVLWVKNQHFQQEMLSSIKIGVTHLDRRIQAFFLQPGDMPFVKAQTYGKLISVFDPNQMDMLRPRHENKGGHPVLISVSKIESILAFQGEGGLRALVKQQRWRTVDLDGNDPGILIDLNKPEDIKNAATKLTDT